MARAATDYLMDFVAGLPDAPASDLDLGSSDRLLAALHRPPPDGPTEFAALLELVRAAAAKGLETAGPGYLAYIPGGGLFASAVGDYIARGTNRFVNLAGAAPAFAQLEAGIVRWLCDLFEFPPEAMGLLTSGGSMANFSAIVSARTALLPRDFLAGTLYVSEQSHGSVAKSARLAGFPPERVRVAPCTADLRVDVNALETMVVTDRSNGLQPFFVVANAGTTNTGTVDPIPALADLARRHGLWLHADAAYGGFFWLTERGRARLAGIQAAESITLDPHKGLFLPYGTGALVARDGAQLRAAHSDDPAASHYLQDLEIDLGVTTIPNFADHGPELSRGFRGLGVWLPLHLHGLGAFRAALDEKLDLAAQAHRALAADPRLEVPWEPDLSTVAFRLAGGDDDDNRRFLRRINDSRRIRLSSTDIGGRFTLRMSILSFRTHADRVAEALDIILDRAHH